MGKSNLMIRMIDVVFILLFGFMAVSQISSAKSIDPPKSTEATEDSPEGTHIVIVGIEKKGIFTIGSGDIVFTDLFKLQKYLAKVASESRSNGKKIGVRIRSNWDAPVEHSLAVAKICKRLGVPKGIDVIRVIGN